MRLKHIKNAENLIYNNKSVIKEPFKNKGKIKDIFGNTMNIEIEIGMGKGNFLITKAIDNPNINYIGIEKYASTLLGVAKKIDDLGLKNIKIICADAINIEEIFDREIDKLYLNFSDPWPKKRHEKRRLTSDKFLKKYENIFKKNKIIELKTDNDEFFDYSLSQFKKYEYKIIETNRNVFSNYKTEYEIKFSNKGKNINYCKVEK